MFFASGFADAEPRVVEDRAMMKAAGFETIKIERTVNYFPLQFLVKHLLWALGMKVENVPSFGNASIGLKLGNMLAIARITTSVS